MCKLTFLSECYSFFWPDLLKKGRLMNDQSLEEDYDSLSVDLVTYFPSVSSLSAIDCLTSRASSF